MSAWRSVAPAGAPIGLLDLGRWAGRALSSTRAADDLASDIRVRFGVRHSRFTSTGRAGLTLVLRALRRLAPPDRDEVILPSYTCYSVAASIAKAGLKPRLVDITPETLDFAPGELAATDASRALAIIGTNLYGLPSDMPALARFARQHGIFLVDDAAQAMGASVHGQWAGTWGDAGLFSFDKGKNVSSIDGGVVVTQSDDVARALDLELAALPRPGLTTSAVHIAKALAYFVLLRPWLYGVPSRIPQLKLGTTAFTTEFPLAHPDSALVALAVVMMRHLDEFTAARCANAEALLMGLRRTAGVSTIEPRRDSTGVYLRLPILLANDAQRQVVIGALVGAGIGATASYPACLVDVPELRPLLANPSAPCIGGRAVAQRLVTLPTHPFVTSADVVHVIDAILRQVVTPCAA